MKTIRQLFDKVKDDELKKKLFSNANPDTLDVPAETFREALEMSFEWEHTKEGFNYWDKISKETIIT